MPSRSLVAAAFAAALVAAGSAPAQEVAPDRIRIEYGEPKEPPHVELRDGLRQRRALEAVQAILAPLRLPRPLTFRTASCDGEVNAWYEGESVTICYEYVDMIVQVVRKPGRLPGVAEETAFMGAFIEVSLHEAAHALFHMLKIPILGREEDAADQLAALLILSAEPERSPQMIAAIAAVHLDEAGLRNIRQLRRWRLSFGAATRQADVHGTPAQRLYNLICLAYGADPRRFRDLRESSGMPEERKDGCEEEHRQIVHAYETLIRPHVDQERAKQVFGAGSPLSKP
jgi:hypothetical protein